MRVHEDPLSMYGVVHADILMGGQTRGKLMGAYVQFVAKALRTCACLHKNPRIPFTDDTFAGGSKRWDETCLAK